MPTSKGERYIRKCDCIKPPPNEPTVPGDPKPPPPGDTAPPSDGPTSPPDPGSPGTPSGPTSGSSRGVGRRRGTRSRAATTTNLVSAADIEEFARDFAELDADAHWTIASISWDWLSASVVLPDRVFARSSLSTGVVVLDRAILGLPLSRTAPPVAYAAKARLLIDVVDFKNYSLAFADQRAEHTSRQITQSQLDMPEEERTRTTDYGITDCATADNPKKGETKGTLKKPRFLRPFKDLPECLKQMVRAHEDDHYFDAALQAACAAREKARDAAEDAERAVKAGGSAEKKKRALDIGKAFGKAVKDWNEAVRLSECAAYLKDEECIKQLLVCCEAHHECCPCKLVKKIAAMVETALKTKKCR